MFLLVFGQHRCSCSTIVGWLSNLLTNSKNSNYHSMQFHLQNTRPHHSLLRRSNHPITRGACPTGPWIDLGQSEREAEHLTSSQQCTPRNQWAAALPVGWSELGLEQEPPVPCTASSIATCPCLERRNTNIASICWMNELWKALKLSPIPV